MKQEEIVRCIVIHDDPNEVETSLNAIRAAGLGVRHQRIESQIELDEALENQRWDLILAKPESNDIEISKLAEVLATTNKDIPLIALADCSDEGQFIVLMNGGVRDVVSPKMTKRLQLVVTRELNDLAVRRKWRKSESTARESEKRCRILIDSSRDAIAYIHEGMHVYANSVYLSLFGYDDFEDVEGLPIMDMISSDEHAEFKQFLRSYSKNEGSTQSIDVNCLRTDESRFKAAMEFSLASIDGEHCTQIIIRNKADSRELEQKLKYLSKQDLLTGLYNRQYFMEEMELSASRAINSGESSALLYMSIDNYKTIKDEMGLATADLMLGNIATILQDKIKKPNLAARFEGGVFTILLQDKNSVDAESVAKDLCDTIAAHIAEVEDKSVATSCSIGISLITETTPNANEVLSRADLACSVAVEKGSSTWHLHNPVADEKASKERESQWAEKITLALTKDRFKLVYQPIVSLHGDMSENYEVLVRYVEDNGEEVAAGHFIPAAEHTGQIADIDKWVIKNAIFQLAKEHKAGKKINFFIKLSGQSLKDENLLIFISENLKANMLKGDSLVFEVAESTACEQIKYAKTFSKTLEQLHCKFALEHFGSGMNSFNMLKHLNVDFLKIDGSFIHNLAENRENQAMVKSITEMAHSMGKLTIAEFVQDANSLTLLWKCGVNYIQGHYLSEPTGNLDYNFAGDGEAEEIAL